MSEAFIGEIRMFAGNYPPRNWAMCTGQLQAISSNNALFSLLGTTYGGDGRTTFGLPDMRGRVPLHWGAGPGLTARAAGQQFGVESVALTESEMPAHNHAFMASSDNGTQDSAANAVIASQPGDDYYFVPLSDPADKVDFDDSTIKEAGSNHPHTNMMPTQCLSFIIALSGTYPSRN